MPSKLAAIDGLNYLLLVMNLLFVFILMVKSATSSLKVFRHQFSFYFVNPIPKEEVILDVGYLIHAFLSLNHVLV